MRSVLSLLILLTLPAHPPPASVSFDGEVVTLNVVCPRYPRCSPCPDPRLQYGGVIPAILSMDGEYVRVPEYVDPERRDLVAWKQMQTMLGPVVSYYELRLYQTFNGTDLHTLCERDRSDAPCTFAHLAALYVRLKQAPTWWADYNADDVVDLRDVAWFQNHFEGDGGDGED